jgi:hypothetical protein
MEKEEGRENREGGSREVIREEKKSFSFRKALRKKCSYKLEDKSTDSRL